MKRVFSCLMILILIFSFTLTAAAQGEEVVSLGANLTEAQEKQILDLFNVQRDKVKIVKVTNEEERTYLEGIVSDEKIGTKAISSAYVKPLGKGEGITVETHNITWVTREIFANAMVTAGVENARVVAAAPFKVSGTAALTGIMKAFEQASGENLNEDAKKAASEELVTTGELGEELGQNEAAALIKEIKEKIVGGKVKEEKDIRKIVIDIAAKLEIKLSDEQIDQIVSLMKKISNLDLSVEKISGQIEKITGHLKDIKKVVNENKGLIQKILDAIQGFFSWLQGLLKKA